MADKTLFPEILKNLRTDNNLNQQELADKLQVSRSVISYYESGKRTPNIEFLVNLSKFFDVSTDYLFGVTEHKTSLSTSKKMCERCSYKQDAKDSADCLDLILDILEKRNLKIAKPLLQAYETRGESDTVSIAVFEQVKWERDTALKTLEEHGIGLGQKSNMVEVVRCKDCVEWDAEDLECSHWYGMRKNCYCSYGIRKEGVEECR